LLDKYLLVDSSQC